MFCIFFEHCKKFNIRDTSEVKVVKFRVFETDILGLYRGECEFLGGVGARVGVVLSFSVLVCPNMSKKIWTGSHPRAGGSGCSAKGV